MASVGPTAPGTLADDNTFGFMSWSNASNAGASDNSYATTIVFLGQTSHYLKATNFSFSIPTGATIDGITVAIEKKGTQATASVKDVRVRIVKGGTVGSTDKSETSAWSTSDATSTYGGAADLWGDTWTKTDIEASTFGCVIACQTTAMGGETASIDAITITVNYTSGGAAGACIGFAQRRT